MESASTCRSVVAAGGEWRVQCRVGQCWWRVQSWQWLQLVESAELAVVAAGRGCIALVQEARFGE